MNIECEVLAFTQLPDHSLISCLYAIKIDPSAKLTAIYRYLMRSRRQALQRLGCQQTAIQAEKLNDDLAGYGQPQRKRQLLLEGVGMSGDGESIGGQGSCDVYPHARSILDRTT